MTTGPSPVRATRAQVARDHLAFVHRNPDALVATALRTKSVHSREIIAELAWPGHTPTDLATWATSAPEGWPKLQPEMDPAWVGRYGLVLAVQTGEPAERVAGRAILEAVRAAGQIDHLPPRAIEMLAQLRVADRDPRAAELAAHPQIREQVRNSIFADLSNPALFGGSDNDEARWLVALNRALGSDDTQPLALLAGGDSAFDRLTVPDTQRVDQGPLVTVVTSAYRPGPALLTAIRSLVEQTWADLEILVVDDASGPDFAEVLNQAAATDPRVRVIRKAVNGGTYRARNTAMRQAKGEFLTVLDSDDWLHPQAIELGVRTMTDAPSVMATRGQGVRVSEDLELNRPGYQPRVTSAPSLMVRVHPVVDRIGFFDPTSKSADTEYARRLQAAFGERSIRDLDSVLTFLRGGDTLSSSEFSRGWRHPARHQYKCLYGAWHKQAKDGEGDGDLFLDPAQPRPFPEPRRWQKPVVADLGPSAHFDLCLAGDWRRFGGPQRSMLEEITAARAAGLKVAIMHLEAFRFMTTRDLPLCSPITELIRAGDVEWVHVDDDVDIDVLMVRYPPILQYPPVPGRTTARVRQLLIMANQAPLEPDGSDQRYDVGTVAERAEELFGVRPVWVPQGPVIRRILMDQDPDLPITDWDNGGLIDISAWQVRSHTLADRGQDKVVIGRYSRDNAGKFAPTLEEILRGYRFDERFEVRFMGGQNTFAKLAAEQEMTLADLPGNWTLWKHKKVDVVDFLADLDFFLYLDNPSMNEAFGRTLLEAAASGVLTIAHPKHGPTFGDTIDYALPGQAQELIAEYVADPQRYAERVAKSQQRVRERFGHEGFARRIGGLLARPELGLDPTDDQPRRQPLTPPDLRVRATGVPDAPLLVEVDPPWQLSQLTLRAGADAGRADHLSVVYHPDGHEVVRHWLREALAGHPGDSLPQVLMDTVPAEVEVVLLSRDGLVHLISRGEQPGGRHRAELRGLGLDLPPGWLAESWRP